jgi:hypothetical protein
MTIRARRFFFFTGELMCEYNGYVGVSFKVDEGSFHKKTLAEQSLALNATK